MNPIDLFAVPEALPLLVAAPLTWLLLRGADRKRDRRFADLVGPRRRALARDASDLRRGVRRALFASGVLLALSAVLRPVWGESATTLEPRGVDVVLCLDVSRSMLARDAGETRLATAKREILDLAKGARGDRFGLVAFAGDARLVAPLTSDADSLVELVDGTDLLTVSRGGSDLGAALDTALGALRGGPGAQEAIILLTDGEDLEGGGQRAAALCRSRGVAVHCVGFGSVRGSKIAVPGARGEEFVRDRSGGDVVSAMDPAGLRRIAEAGGGTFVEAAGEAHPLLDLHENQVLSLARKSFAAAERRRRESRFQWPLAAAYLLWILELCITDRRRR